MASYYAAKPDRDFLHATGDIPPAGLQDVKLDNALPNRLGLLQQGLLSETEALVAQYMGGEIIDLAAGELASRQVRVTTPTDSYTETRTYLGIGAGQVAADVTDVVTGESAIGEFALINPASVTSESEARIDPAVPAETEALTQTPTTALPQEQTGSENDPVELITLEEAQAAGLTREEAFEQAGLGGVIFNPFTGFQP